MSTLSKRLMGGWTELHVAAAAGDLARVRHAVQKNPADVDKATRGERQTALHLAAAAGFEAVVGELLDRQAKTTLQDEAGRTPLHAAAVEGRARCVGVLLSYRNRDPPAERTRMLALKDRDGRDALMAAVVAGQAAVVEELLRGGADPARCVDKAGCGLVLAAVQHSHIHLLPLLAPVCGLEQRDPVSGGTPLHRAAQQGNLQALEWLLRAGANAATRDNTGSTPFEAARAAGHPAACKALREALAGSPAGGGGGSGGGPQPSGASGTGHDIYSPPAAPAGAATGPPASPTGYSVPTPTPWQQQQGGTGWAQGGQEGAAAGGRVLEVPINPPAPAFYPTPPAGAGVYY